MPAPIRGSDIFIAEDIRRNMRSIAATHEATMRLVDQPTQYAQGYSDGFIDGLRAMAEALGIPFQPGIGNVAIGARWDG